MLMLDTSIFLIVETTLRPCALRNSFLLRLPLGAFSKSEEVGDFGLCSAWGCQGWGGPEQELSEGIGKTPAPVGS